MSSRAPSRMTRCAVALLVSALEAASFPTLAAAAPPWTPPVVLAAPIAPRVEATDVDQARLVPQVSTGAAGLQLATWPAPGQLAGTGNGVLVALDGDRVVRIRRSRFVTASRRYARTRVLHLVAHRIAGYREFPRVRLSYRVGDSALSELGTRHAIGGPRTIRDPPALAVNRSGAAIAAWRHVRRGRLDEIQVAVRPAGGRFGPVQTVQREAVEAEASIAVGIDAGGRAVVAYARDTRAHAPTRLAIRVIDTRTGSVARESRVAPPAGLRGPTEIVVGAQPQARSEPIVIAWRGYPLTEGPLGTIDTAAAVLPAGSQELDRAQPLAKGRVVAYPRGPITATVDTAGRPVVAWGEPTRGPARTVPTVAQATPEGSFGAPQPLDTAGSVGSLIAQDEGLAVGWLRETPGPEGHGSPLGVRVARRGPDGPFEASELVDDFSIAGGLPQATSADGLQPPGLGLLPSGGLTAVCADSSPNGRGGQTRVSTRPPG